MNTRYTISAQVAVLALSAVVPAFGQAQAATASDALNATGVTKSDTITGFPAAPIGLGNPFVSGDGNVVVFTGANGNSPTTAVTPYTMDATNGFRSLPLPSVATAAALAMGISNDGSVVAGIAMDSRGEGGNYAVVWRSGVVTVLPTAAGEPTGASHAWGVSGNGRVVVGDQTLAPARWIDAGAPTLLTGTGFGIAGLGVIGQANAANTDGSVIVGYGNLTTGSQLQAFRWTQSTGLVSLGQTGNLTLSRAAAVSADGSVVAGTVSESAANALNHMFRWTQSSGMVDLGLYNNTSSSVSSMNSDGSIIGGATASVGLIWTQAGGIKTVTEYLTSKGVTVAGSTVLQSVNSISGNGNVITGGATFNGVQQTYIARIAGTGTGSGTGTGTTPTPSPSPSPSPTPTPTPTPGSGTVTPTPTPGTGTGTGVTVGTGIIALTPFLNTVLDAASFQSALSSLLSMAMNGAHHRTLMDYDIGDDKKSCAWATGDIGGSGGPKRQQYSFEMGLCHDVAEGVRLGFGAGYDYFSRDLTLNGKAKASGYHLVAEADITPAGSPLTVSMLGYYGNFSLDTKRSYQNGAAVDTSTANTKAHAWALRGRVDWRDAIKIGEGSISPYLSYTHTSTVVNAFTEQGGGFPVAMNRTSAQGDETRLGAMAKFSLSEGVKLGLSGEWAHRFDRDATQISGAIVGGLSPFAFTSGSAGKDWARGGLDLDIKTSSNSVLSLSGRAMAGNGRDADLSGAVSFRLGF